MKTQDILFRFAAILVVCSCLHACKKNEILANDVYACDLGFADSSAAHPKASIYENILASHRKNGLVGAVLLVKDKDGLWMGSDGKADIASGVDVKVCNTFLIASISKVFTSAAVYRYVDKGVLSLEDPVSTWLDSEVVEKVKNCDQAKIKHLLAHTSGIADYYTLQFEMDRINKVTNGFTKEDVLKYVYGKNPTNDVGETYYYSNTNFLLLAMILERASGMNFEEVYQQEVFIPLGLNSAYYGEENPIPPGCIKGYVDVYDNGQYIESEFLYNDELGIGGDGGIAINAYDLATFLEELMKGNLISISALEDMTSWFAIPEGWHWTETGQTENGYGIEKFNTTHGPAVGHSGGIDGFSSLALYFPDEDMTYVLITNTAGNKDGAQSQAKIFEETLQVMFQ